MDSLTHIALGACIGELMAGKKLGRKAMLWGAVAQSLPDIDFVAGIWNSPAEDLLAHRGFTHSFLFIVLLTPLLALLADRWHRFRAVQFRQWLLFFGLQMTVHILVDVLNAYGTGWLEPFSHVRLACNMLFVADPFFTLPLLVAAIVLLFRRGLLFRKRWAIGGIMLTGVYMFYAGFNKLAVEQVVKDTVVKKQINSVSHFSTPTPFNTWLWYVVVKDTAGFHVGYRSVFDQTPFIDFQFVPQQDSLLSPVRGQEDLQHLVRFSKGYYTVEQRGDSLVLNDLRFGQIMGWQNPKAGFVFYYYLQHPSANALLVQRGRMAGWTAEAWIRFWDRIRGIK